ncbi:MAG TPA: hypothetical protein VLM05_03250 [Mycobacteriales bacterium]|nr:hypothetical protein [Mycobacteriales bacterium]
MAEVLSGGSDGPARPRRWLVVAAVLIVGAVLAVRAAGDDPAGPPAVRPIVVAPPRPSVVSVAVGARWTYALVSVCDSRIVHECDYRVYRRDITEPGWRPLSMHVTGRTTVGLAVTLRVSGNDRIALVQRNENVVSSPDGGTTVVTRPLRRGPPIAALPAGGIVADGLCDGCDEQVTVLDPATGAVRPLATQPAFQGFGLRLARADGDVVWVAQVGPAAASTAVSRDGGRSWRTLPLAGGLLRTGPVVLTAALGGGAYLVGRRSDALLPDVRRIDGPGGRWRRLTPPAGPVSPYSAVADERGLLIGDADGRAWRLMDNGEFLVLPGTPGYLAGGPGRVLAGLPSTPGTVQISSDGGVTWRVERVVG